jgi:hypothetical protein
MSCETRQVNAGRVAAGTVTPVLVLLIVALAGRPARAQANADSLVDAPTAAQEPRAEARPWEGGVDANAKADALALHKQGNRLLRQLMFAEAVVKYRAALAHWDHPRIHYHIALALIQLGDDPIAAYASIGQALRYHGDGLMPDEFTRARDLQLLLRRQLVEVEVTAVQDGVSIALDGTHLVTGPGAGRRLVRPGRHQITASKPGYLPISRTVLALPGQDQSATVELVTLAETRRIQRRWANWKPWALAGTGVSLLIASGVLHAVSRRTFDDFDQALKATPECEAGCRDSDPASPSHILRRAERQQSLAFAGYAVGGTALAAGFILAYFNRVRVYESDVSNKGFRLTVRPELAPGGASVTLGLSF